VHRCSFDKYFSELHDYGTFEAGLAPAFKTSDDDDNDLIPLFMEYVLGADPTTTDDIRIAQLNSYIKDERFVISIATRSALTDVRIQPQTLVGSSWNDIGDGFDHQTYSISEERIMHEFISRTPVSEWQTTGIFRLAFNPVSAENREISASRLLGVSNPVVLAGGDGGWLPTLDGNGLQAPNRPSERSSVMTFHVNSTNQVSFDYSVLAQSGATLHLKINGTTVQTWTDASGSGTFSYTHGDPNAVIDFVIDYGPSSATVLESPFASISNVALD
jgi:hypothetical protein